MKIYLAGGMHNNWRYEVENKFLDYEDIIWYNPNLSELSKPEAYTFWDMTAIERCDLIFGYLEKDNPSGMGMMFEMGYAKGLGKKVIFINEQPDNHHTSLAGCFVDYVCDSLEDGIFMLCCLV